MMATRGQRTRWAFVEVTAAMAIAGSSVVPAEVAQAHLPLFVVSFMSFVFALAVTIPLQLTRLEELRSLRGREVLLMLLQALFGMVLFRVFLLLGLRYTSAVDAGVIMGSGPAVTVCFGVVVFGEGLSGRRVAAIFLSIAGLVSIYLAGGNSAGGANAAVDGSRTMHEVVHIAAVSTSAGTGAYPHRVLGDMLVLFAVVSESLLTVFRKLSVRAVSSLTNTTVLSLASAVMTLPLAAAGLTHPAAHEFTPAVWVSLAYYGSFVTVVGYLLWGDGALHLPAGSVGIATGAMPLTSALLAALVLGDAFGPVRFLGCLFVVGSIVLSSRG